MQLDEMLRNALDRKAQEVTIGSPEIWQRIESRISEQQKEKTEVPFQARIRNFFSLQGKRKKTVFATICSVLVVTLLFTMTPLQTFAIEKLQSFGTMMIISKKGNGPTMETHLAEFNSIAEAQSKVSFPILIPSYLPEGQIQHIMAGSSENGMGFVNISYNNMQGEGTATRTEGPNPRLTLMLTNNKEEIRGQSITFGNQTAYWSEINFYYGKKAESTNKPVENKDELKNTPPSGTHHRLMWEKNGVTYTLIGDLNQDDMIKVAQSIQ